MTWCLCTLVWPPRPHSVGDAVSLLLVCLYCPSGCVFFLFIRRWLATRKTENCVNWNWQQWVFGWQCTMHIDRQGGLVDWCDECLPFARPIPSSFCSASIIEASLQRALAMSSVRRFFVSSRTRFSFQNWIPLFLFIPWQCIDFRMFIYSNDPAKNENRKIDGHLRCLLSRVKASRRHGSTFQYRFMLNLSCDGVQSSWKGDSTRWFSLIYIIEKLGDIQNSFHRLVFLYCNIGHALWHILCTFPIWLCL